MATATHVPLESYLCASYEPDADYVDGTIEERPAGEYGHAAWQAAVQKWFWMHEREWNIRALPELRVRTASTRFRVPDVTILDRNQAVERIVTRAPVAVFEILSPEDTLQRLKRKLEDYAGMGISQIWVIDPQDSTFYCYRDRQLLRQEEFAEPTKAISFSMSEMAKLLD